MLQGQQMHRNKIGTKMNDATCTNTKNLRKFKQQNRNTSLQHYIPINTTLMVIAIGIVSADNV